MEDSNTVLYIATAVVIVVVLALVLGRSLLIEKTANGYKLKTRAKPQETGQDIDVASNLKLKGSKTGDIAAIKSDSTPATNQKLNVLKGAEIENSTTGDIVGIKKETNLPKNEK